MPSRYLLTHTIEHCTFVRRCVYIQGLRIERSLCTESHQFVHLSSDLCSHHLTLVLSFFLILISHISSQSRARTARPTRHLLASTTPCLPCEAVHAKRLPCCNAHAVLIRVFMTPSGSRGMMGHNSYHEISVLAYCTQFAFCSVHRHVFSGCSSESHILPMSLIFDTSILYKKRI